jgi:hypothetical protein
MPCIYKERLDNIKMPNSSQIKRYKAIQYGNQITPEPSEIIEKLFLKYIHPRLSEESLKKKDLGV